MVKTHILTGIVFCGKCGRSMTPKTKQKETKMEGIKEYYYYSCSAYNMKGTIKCTQKMKRANFIEDKVFNFLYEYFSRFSNLTKYEVMTRLLERFGETESKIEKLSDLLKVYTTSEYYNKEDYDNYVSELRQAIKRLDILNKKRDLYSSISVENNFVEYLIEDKVVERYIDYYVDRVTITDDKVEVVLHLID